MNSRIALLSTALDSTNDGDSIIYASVLREVPELAHVPAIPTHRTPTGTELQTADSAQILVVTGSNILTGKAGHDRQWPLTERELAAYENKVVFLGVGWREYEADTTEGGTRLKRLMHPQVPVSARDAHTLQILARMDIAAVDTGCPTMWSLPSVVQTPGARDECVATLTDYRPDLLRDQFMIRVLARHYRLVHIWPQSANDLEKLTKMWLPSNVRIADRGLDSLDALLLDRDYVGTRLHAGVRAMQLGSPAIVISVDNRAREIALSTGLPVLRRSADVRQLRLALRQPSKVELSIPHRSISDWLTSFRSLIHQSL
ncbi:MAG: polysaccharide pyruvyl transferase family protein [Microbacterium chocolatum]|nr:polysaccharide pyruvyl transferase family protein [Microbacterium chocolatum]